MITWIQRTFQQHFRFIFLVLLAGVIISFIFVTNASSGFGRGDARGAKRPFFGVDLANEQDAARLQQDAYLSAQINGPYAQDPLGDFESRRALLYTAKQMGVVAPAANTKEFEDFLKKMPAFIDPQTGVFDAVRYNTFRNNLISNPNGYGFTMADFTRIVRENIQIEKVKELVAGSGYAMPADVQQVLKQAETTWTVSVASLDRSTFKPTITPTDFDLTQYFERNAARYTIAPRVRVSYAEISATQYASSVVVNEAEVRALYDANPARFPKPANTTPAAIAAPATPDSDYNAVRPQVEAALRLQRANTLAGKAASDLANKLYQAKMLPGSMEFNSLLAQSHAVMHVVPDFSADDVPSQMGSNSYAIAREAFALNADNRISNSIATGNGAIILFWQENIAKRDPLFAEVVAKVKADYINEETQRRFVALGDSIKAQVQAAVKTGTSFEEAVTKAAGSVTVTTKTLEPFSIYLLRERMRTGQSIEGVDGAIVGALQNMQQGEVSSMLIAGTTGRIVYAKTALLPDMSTANPRYAVYAEDIAQSFAQANLVEYVRKLVSDEHAKNGPVAN